MYPSPSPIVTLAATMMLGLTDPVGMIQTVRAAEGAPERAEVLTATEPLTWAPPLDVRMREGAYRFIERKTAESIRERAQYWHRDFSSPEAYETSIQGNRDRFRRIIGVVDDRLPVTMERVGDEANPALVAETPSYRVFQVRWAVLKNIHNLPVVYGEGLLLEPKAKRVACVVALPDADQTPEQLVGLAPGIPGESQFARRLAESGFEVVVPVLASRAPYRNLSQREWIHRQAFHMGRHVIGYEVQKILAAVDWFKRRFGSEMKIGAAGYGEGGLEAFYAAAVDPRIDAALVSGYFDSRQQIGREPLYRTVWGLLREFGDAEIATLVAPRGLVVEHSPTPTVENQKGGMPLPTTVQARAAEHVRVSGGAEPLPATPALESVQREFERIATMSAAGFQPRELVCGPDDGPAAFGSPKALAVFSQMLGVTVPLSAPQQAAQDQRAKPAVAERQNRQVSGMEDHVQGLLAVALEERDRFFMTKVEPRFVMSRWGQLPPMDRRKPLADDFIEGSKFYRQYFWREILGKVDDPFLPLNPRSRKFREEPKWIAYDVVLDVWPEVFAWGLILLPKDLAPGEKRPTVLVQPGLESLPERVLARTGTGRPAGYVWGVAARLADRGFVVFVPHNLYRGQDSFRNLDKAARAVKATMWSLMLGQHERILEWLSGLPGVDASRIGFYGCSYGGTSAMYIPPMLEQYCLSICSANFNEWTSKIASTTWDTSYLRGGVEWEFQLFNMGNTFSHAELAYLMAPRPFMVERGMYDPVAYDWHVGMEYAKVRWLYTQLGIEDRTEIEFSPGPHGFLCKEAFQFLHRHLNWPEPTAKE